MASTTATLIRQSAWVSSHRVVGLPPNSLRGRVNKIMMKGLASFYTTETLSALIASGMPFKALGVYGLTIIMGSESPRWRDGGKTREKLKPGKKAGTK